MKLKRARAGLWLAAGLCCVACTPDTDAQSEPETAAPGISDETLELLAGDEAPSDELVSFSVPPEELITGEGIGLARPGATLGALQAALGDAPARFEQRFMVDLSAVCVDDDDGSELYCAAFPETAQPRTDTEILMVVTRHPRFRTQEGVGPGVRLADAEVVYGDAFLNYSLDNESREYVEFDDGPAGSIGFRPVNPAAQGELAGVYEDDEDGFQETDVYRPGAVIGAVEVTAPPRR